MGRPKWLLFESLIETNGLVMGMVSQNMHMLPTGSRIQIFQDKYC